MAAMKFFSDTLPQRMLFLEREPMPVLDLFHATFIARDFHANAQPQPFLQLYFGFMLSALGGGLINSLILGAPVAWLTSDTTFFTYTAVFLLAFSPPTRGLFRAITNAPLLRHVISAGEDITWATSIALGGMQRALTPVHTDSNVSKTVCAALVCGTIGGCGGGFLRSMLNFNRPTWSFSSPLHFTANPWPLRFSFFLASVYYILLNPHGYLPLEAAPQHEAKWVIITLCLCGNTLWNALGVSSMLATDKKTAAPVPAQGGRKKVAASSSTVQLTAAAQEHSDEDEEDEAESPSQSRKARKRRSKQKKSSQG